MRSSQLTTLSASLIETNLNPYLSIPPSTSFRGQIVEYGAFTLLWVVTLPFLRKAAVQVATFLRIIVIVGSAAGGKTGATGL